MFILCSVSLIMSQVTATTTPPVIVVYSSTSPITVTVTMAPTSVFSAVLCQHDVALPPQLVLRDIKRGFVGLPTVLVQQQPQC